jgi:hypothetical protein
VSESNGLFLGFDSNSLSVRFGFDAIYEKSEKRNL